MLQVAGPLSVTQTPPAVDMSSFVKPASDTALGRLPLRSVPQTVQSPKSDEQRSNQQQRQASESPAANASAKPANFSFLVNGKESEAQPLTPFSAPFIAQLFGQIASDAPEGAGIAAIWLGNGKSLKDQSTSLAERMDEYVDLKYAPSGAKPSLTGANTVMQEWRAQNAQSLTYRRPMNRQDTASLFTGGIGAYSSAQSRSLSQASARAQEISIQF